MIGEALGTETAVIGGLTQTQIVIPVADKWSAEPPKPRNQVPGKVVTHRTEFWRKTVANQLMAQGERNQRVLAALVLGSGRYRAQELAR